MKRSVVSSGTEWEAVVGYARAVRVGPHVHVSGTTVTNEDGAVIGEGDAAAQTRQVLENVERALRETGARLEDVVRTCLYVTDIARDCKAIGRAHAEAFAGIRPATSMVEVRRLIDERMLVEIEADAEGRTPRGGRS